MVNGPLGKPIPPLSRMRLQTSIIDELCSSQWGLEVKMMSQLMGIQINRDVITVEPISVYLLRLHVKHSPSLPPSLAAIFTLKNATRKSSVTIMSCLFVSILKFCSTKHLFMYIFIYEDCGRFPSGSAEHTHEVGVRTARGRWHF